MTAGSVFLIGLLWIFKAGNAARTKQRKDSAQKKKTRQKKTMPGFAGKKGRKFLQIEPKRMHCLLSALPILPQTLENEFANLLITNKKRKKGDTPSYGSLNECYMYMSAISTSHYARNARIVKLQVCNTAFFRFSNMYIYKAQELTYVKLKWMFFMHIFETISKRL